MTQRTVAFALVTLIAVMGVGLAALSFWDPAQAIYHAQPQDIVGTPLEWQLNFSHPFSLLQHWLLAFHNFLLVISILISGLVAALVVFIVVRFRASQNPEPARTTHNTALEIIWTVVPVIILIAIALWSFPLLRAVDMPPRTELTVKAVGNQWFWTYSYPDQKLEITSVQLSDDKLSEQQRPQRMLAVDNYLVLPIDTTILIQVTAADVVHSFGVQSLGIKKDAVPGRLNETWTRIEREGFYYGDCYELCGRRHAYMPVGIQAVSRDRFQSWLRDAQARRNAGLAPLSVAAGGPGTRGGAAAWRLGSR